MPYPDAGGIEGLQQPTHYIHDSGHGGVAPACFPMAIASPPVAGDRHPMMAPGNLSNLTIHYFAVAYFHISPLRILNIKKFKPAAVHHLPLLPLAAVVDLEMIYHDHNVARLGKCRGGRVIPSILQSITNRRIAAKYVSYYGWTRCPGPEACEGITYMQPAFPGSIGRTGNTKGAVL